MRFQCNWCAPGTVRISEHNLVYWKDGPEVVCYDPATNAILWKSNAEIGGFGDLILGPDGTLYALGLNSLTAVEGDGTGLCRDCPWPAPEHDQQRTNRFGAELVEYLPR